MALTRYWFEFDFDDDVCCSGTSIGCGVTAHNYNDALFLLSQKVFKSGPLPKIKKVIENVDVSTLDAGHVLPNMFAPNFRGIWYPSDYM